MKKTKEKEIYLDNSATTKPSPAAIARMTEVSENFWGNPSSVHAFGFASEKLLAESRESLLSVLGSKRGAGELVFCASGTEADNLAIFGTAFAKKRLEGGRIIVTDSEHPAVMRPAEELERRGFELVRLRTVGGVIDPDELAAAITPKTILLSIMTVNNETGAAFDTKGLFALAKRLNPEILTHTDAVQGFLKLSAPLVSSGADLITVSSHKIHGPKGVGALYIKSGLIKSKSIVPVTLGGGQEKGFRSGTENLPGIAGFAAAAREGAERLADSLASMRACREHLLSRIAADPALSSVRVNTPGGEYAAHIISITVPGIRSEVMLRHLSGLGIYVSSGSACSSHSTGPGYSLLAFGLDRKAADCTIRVSLSPYTVKEDMDALSDGIASGLSGLAHTNQTF